MMGAWNSLDERSQTNDNGDGKSWTGCSLSTFMKAAWVLDFVRFIRCLRLRWVSKSLEHRTAAGNLLNDPAVIGVYACF